jgi:endo-1,4-beta-D-glucanase Y
VCFATACSAGGDVTPGTNGTGGSAMGGANNGGSANGTGSGGSGNGSSGGSGTGSSGGTGNTGTWHGAIATLATDAVLNSAYSSWRTQHVQDCADGSSVVRRDAGSVVSEGIGYGMLIAVGMDDQTLFDRLFKHYTDHLDPRGLMNWAMGVCDPAGNNNANAATDAELDVTMALVQGDRQWSGNGYLAQAEALAAKILQYEVDADCGGHATLRPGDMWGGCSDNGQINPSYYAPGYFRVFAAKFPSQTASWNALLDASYWLYPVLQARMAGLVPNWSRFDGTDWYGETYGYDACRTPWRVATDYAWSGDDRARTFLVNVTTWIDGHGGLPTAAQQQNSAFLGSFALAGIYDQAKLDGYVTGWLGAQMDDAPYFQNSLKMLYLLLAAGRFPSAI